MLRKLAALAVVVALTCSVTIATSSAGGTAAPAVERKDLARFVVLAEQWASLGAGTTVESGDVRVGGRSGALLVGSRATLPVAEARWLHLAGRSQVVDAGSRVRTGPGTVTGRSYRIDDLPGPALPEVTEASRGTRVVHATGTSTLAPGAYRSVVVAPGATLHVGGLTEIGTLEVLRGGRLLATEALDLRLGTSLSLADRARLEPVGPGMGAADIVVSTRANDRRLRPTVRVGNDAIVSANLLAPFGSVRIGRAVTLVGSVHAWRATIGADSNLTHASSFGAGSTSLDPGRLAEQLRGASSTGDRIPLIEEILAAAGIATATPDQEFREPVAPRATTIAYPGDVASYALDLDRSAANQLTGAEVAQFLADAGWPFPAGTDPLDELLPTLRRWVAHAAAQPDEPTSFGPRFLAASLAGRGTPLTTVGLTADQVHLTKLDVAVLAASFQRLLTDDVAPAQARTASMQASFDTPGCTSILEQWLGGIAGSQAAAAWAKVNGSLIESLLGENTNEKFGKATFALDLLSKVAKLALRYHALTGTMAIDPQTIHKPIIGNRELTAFTLTVGISDEAWNAYVQRWAPGTDSGLSECLSLAGLPAIPDLGDVRKTMADWRVEWDGLEGMPTHGFISLDVNDFTHPGQLQMGVREKNLRQAEATLVVDVAPEPSAVHNGGGQLLTAPVTVLAQVETDAPPGTGVFTGGVWGGMLGAVTSGAELLAGLIQNEWTTDIPGTVEVQYEASNADYDVTIRYTYEDGGTPGAPTSHLTGELTLTGAVHKNGTSRFLANGSGGVTYWDYAPSGGIRVSCQGPWSFVGKLFGESFLVASSQPGEQWRLRIQEHYPDPTGWVEETHSDGCENVSAGRWLGRDILFDPPAVGATVVVEDSFGSTGSDRYRISWRAELTRRR